MSEEKGIIIIMKYRRKAQQVEAFQIPEYPEWVAEMVYKGLLHFKASFGDVGICIGAMKNVMFTPGDYLLLDEEGGITGCHKGVFKRNYEAIDE